MLQRSGGTWLHVVDNIKLAEEHSTEDIRRNILKLLLKLNRSEEVPIAESDSDNFKEALDGFELASLAELNISDNANETVDEVTVMAEREQDESFSTCLDSCESIEVLPQEFNPLFEVETHSSSSMSQELPRFKRRSSSSSSTPVIRLDESNSLTKSTAKVETEEVQQNECIVQ